MRASGTKANSTNQYRGLGDQLYDLGGARPTLDLNFSNNESLVDSVTGKNLVTHTRASSATYVDGDGVIKDAVTNLLTYSEDFSQWSQFNLDSVAADAIIAPDNKSTATLIVPTDTISADRLTRGVTVNASTTHVLSVYLKSSGITSTSIRYYSDSGFKSVQVDLSAGTISAYQGTTDNRVVENVGNGWYRFSFSFDSGADITNSQVQTARASAPKDGINGYYIWGAQLETGPYAGDYAKTTSAAASSARTSAFLPNGNGNFVSAGELLLEDAGTNLVEYSEDATQLSLSQIIIELNQGTAPDGTNTANKVSNVNNSSAFLAKIGLAAGTYTFSFWIKAVENNTGTWGVNYYFGSHNRTTVPVTTEWVRHSVSFTSGASTNIYFADNREGLATLNEALVWGLQIEQNSYATSYIPTFGATATRAADVSSSSSNTLGNSFYKQSVGTVFVSATTDHWNAKGQYPK